MPFSFFLRTVYETKSKISGEILVKEQFGQYKLYVQGVLQSGGIVGNIWKKPLKKIRNSTVPAGRQEFEIRSSLILGLGGGTVVQLIKQDCPNIKITGIELDSEIIKISRRFFNLDKFKNLKIINANAIEWVEFCFHVLKHGNKKFDLIVIDLYLGKKFPEEAEKREFLENVKKLLSKDGLAVFNRLRSRGEDLAGFEEKLKNRFSSVEKVKTMANLFFICC